jgi:CRP-like cAMP-binding protein
VLREMDHFIGALTPVTVAQITRELFEEVTLAQPRLLQALWWDSLVNTAIQREWIMSLGSRNAYERITALMVETFVRLRAAGRTRGMSCDWPLTQATVADFTGLSVVHVNRTYQEIREAGLVDVENRTLTIHDLEALMAAALFHPGYLHLEREGRHLDANDAEEGLTPEARAREG